MTEPSIENLRKASTAIYIAVETSVADDISKLLVWAANEIERLSAPKPEARGEAWPEPKVTNPDIADPTGVPYFDCLIHRVLDAQQDINFSANEGMDQSLANAAALLDEVEQVLRTMALYTRPSQGGEAREGCWTNTYGHPFSGEPDGWAPLQPFSTPPDPARPATEGETDPE